MKFTDLASSTVGVRSQESEVRSQESEVEAVDSTSEALMTLEEVRSQNRSSLQAIEETLHLIALDRFVS